MESISSKEAVAAVTAMIETIRENRQHLSDIDGLIGDGDHGINMHKGFQRCKAALDTERMDLSEGLRCLSSTLMDLGGSMGPLYGMLFSAMARQCREQERIDAKTVSSMLAAAEVKVAAIGQCLRGEKTLLDVLAPAREAFDNARSEDAPFTACLESMKSGADRGREATVDMIAQKGRASRLGERSRGVPDPGATSCCLLLTALAQTLQRLLQPQSTPS